MEIAICQLISRGIQTHHCILYCLCIVLPLAFTWFLELILLHDVQLPFPVDCLYADPDRTVICCLVHTLMMPIRDFSSFSDCKFWLKQNLFQAYDVLGLYHGFGRTFFNPASVNIFCFLQNGFGCTFCMVYTMMFYELTVTWQAKVFSRFEALQKAVKNYTIEATPDDRSGVLQQVRFFCLIIKDCFPVCTQICLLLGIISKYWSFCFRLY